MITILAFVIVLGVLITVHEFGHFIVARLCGVGVEKFSLGFGPRLFGKKIGMTDYRVSAIPLGGYVKMVGEAPDDDISPEMRPLSFTHKSVWRRILIVAAGPSFNLFLTVAILFFLYLVFGVYILKPTIGEVKSNTPAAIGGIKAGDEVVAIDDTPVDSWTQMSELVSASNGREISVVVRRQGQTVTCQVTPNQISDKNMFGEEIQRYVIGILSAGDTRKERYGPLAAFKQGVSQTGYYIKLTFEVFGKIITGKMSARNIGGPVAIARMAGTRRPVGLRARELAQQAGLFILILLMIFVVYNDISNWITGWDPLKGN